MTKIMGQINSFIFLIFTALTYLAITKIQKIISFQVTSSSQQEINQFLSCKLNQISHCIITRFHGQFFLIVSDNHSKS